jgi:RNA processing factor Prp31
VQILGAEKALFRALKTKHDTPKYGLIYHASLIGQTAPKNKGKISRVLAAKTALAIRVDAMGETTDTTLGLESRAKVCAYCIYTYDYMFNHTSCCMYMYILQHGVVVYCGSI